MKTLNDFVKENSKFLKLGDGETFSGTYVSYKVTASKFDPDKETVVYKLKHLEGSEVFFQTASIVVAHTLSAFKGGEAVTITRKGVGSKTSYEITTPSIMTEDDLSPDEDFTPDRIPGAEG